MSDEEGITDTSSEEIQRDIPYKPIQFGENDTETYEEAPLPPLIYPVNSQTVKQSSIQTASTQSSQAFGI